MQTKITDSALRRYKIAAKFLSKYTEFQAISQNLLVLDLIHESKYLRSSCIDFINLMLNINLSPPNMRPLPKKILLRGTKAKKKPI